MNTTVDLVSVVMPVHNPGDYLPISLDSVRHQDYPNCELIVIDDGSTDASENVLESYSASSPGSVKILTHDSRQRRGISASYMLALEHTQGKYIAFLEQDDMWPTNKISEQVKVFNAFPEVGVVFSDVYTCNADGRVSTKPFRTLINKPPSEFPFKAFLRLLWGNCVSTFSNIMVRRDLIHATDIITDPEGFQDWMLLLLLSNRCKFYHCSSTRMVWRQTQNSAHAKLKTEANYRRIRKLAVMRAMGNILQEQRQFSHSTHLFSTEYLRRGYWYLAISLFSAAERIADGLNHTVRSENGLWRDV